MQNATNDAERKTGRPPTPTEDKQAKFTAYYEAVEGGATKKEAIAASGLQWSTLQRWLADDSNTIPNASGVAETFASRLARAQTASAEAYADRGQQELQDATPEDWQVRKARAQYFQWRAAMKYGDKTEVKVSGGIEHLHLDALRSISAKSRIINDLPIVTSPKPLAVTSSDAQPIDTDSTIDTE